MENAIKHVDKVADPLDLENWYTTLEHTTFKTKFFDLSRDEAQCIVDAYDDAKHEGSSAPNKINPEKTEILRKLEEKIQKVISEFGGKAFVRLSTRSPKDIALRRPKTKTILEKELKDLGGKNDEISQVIAIIRCASRAMAAESGAEAMDFLYHSERAYQDLTVRLLRTDFAMKVIVREWVDILPEWEFRGFIHKNNFTGLAQYYKACYVPGMYEQRESIQKRILDLWSSIREKMPTDSYVADFAVTPTKVYLIELNDFAKTTSSSLFDWQKDTKVLHDGPFELRIVPEPIVGVKAMIATPLRKLIGWTDEQVSRSQAQLDKAKEDKAALEEKEKHKGEGEEGCITM